MLELVLGTMPGRRVAERIRQRELTLHAPHLIDVEVAQALRRYDRIGAVEPDRIRFALRLLNELDLERYPHELFLPRIWALRHNLTAYDATYVALAEALDAPLLTRDERMIGAPGVSARIERIR